MLNSSANTRIKKLSPLLINQLAAGEVVTRPAAVVKELLENAIDAGATNIEVHITQGGMGMIEIVDNGAGIHPDDMAMAVTRHATSKVADIANLHGITTLGFRGEALAAVAAVARLTLISSHDDSGIGRQLQVAGVLADMPKLTPVVHNRGTTVTVKDLYFNVPARRGNLKSVATEFSHIETIVREVALARADVTLSLFHDQKKRLSLLAQPASLLSTRLDQSNAKRLPLSRLEQALGSPLSDNALEVTVDLSSLLQQPAMATENVTNQKSDYQAKISGWLWPTDDQQSLLPKLLYVNGRLVKEVLISNQLRQLVTSAELKGLGYALYFELPSHWLNINVHPTKQRIKISPLNNIMAHLSHAVSLKLKALKPKEVSNPQTSTNNFLLKQTSDNNIPSKTLLSTTTLSEAKTSRQQVQAPKQQYQHLATPQLPKGSTDFSVNETVLNQRLQNSDIELPNITASSLPQCLDVINHLPEPWLLLYNQERFLLVSEQCWLQILQKLADNQSKVSPLFEQALFEQSSFKQKKTPMNAAIINQHLAKVVSQLSAQEFATFTVTFEQMLNTNAYKVIDTEQLVALLLSSEIR
ncbi:DNA mismatch repair endonuclease MutL [Psychrobacter sp. CAL346-MNA-CIBAN-0220]|uniref:DNA mismatch repair endonuclease MutL n=1 Tax=Psychrobacter sp. CAL346-MNA-CIBAN-0220 TaxID=3140457 RepID=UPI00332F4C5B